MHKISVFRTILVTLLLLLWTTGGAAAQEPSGDVSIQAAVSTAFTYQGNLKDVTGPVTGSYDFEFGLFDALSGGSGVGLTLTRLNQTVTDGLFSVQLDFGNQFDGTALWLQINVRTAGDVQNGYTSLSPRQPLTATPYALFSTAPWITNGSNLSYNAGNVGIGTTNPSVNLEVVSTSTAEINATAHNSVAQFIGQSAGGSPGAETAVGSGTELAWFGARGYDGTGFTPSRAAMIMNASENWTSAAHGTDIAFGTTANGTTSRTEKMRITQAGSIGIGTATPTKAKVEINGFAGSYPNVPAAGFLNEVTPTGTTVGGFTISSFSLYASNDIGAHVYFAFSDERMKDIEGRSDATQDLSTLLGIEVTDYTYIDTVTKGAGEQKKVIAQQVEKIYPQAVSRSTDVVPDIYQKATIKDGWVEIATDLQIGERVRLIGEKNEGIYEVLEVTPDGFRTDFVADGKAVFVYGREVKDFRSVDYEAIAMLNVSATQELNRLVEQQAAEIEVLTTRLAALEQATSRTESNVPLSPWLFGGLGLVGLAVVAQRRTGGK